MKFTVIATFAVFLSLAFAQDHAHHSEHASEKHLKVKGDGKTYAPTEDLKIRMEKIKSFAKDLDGMKEKQKEVSDIGNKISAVVSDIFSTCKLPSDADAALHPVLGKILEGSEELKKGLLKNGRNKVHTALVEYQKLFSL